jgi:hypothetical protein
MNKKTLSLVALGLFATLCAQASNEGIAAASAGQPGMQKQADCSTMTADEQSFASQLMDPNMKMMFCSKFTPDQRSSCMQMAQQPDASGNMMTPDQAVQKMMQDNNMTMPTTPGKTSKASDTCPVQK